MTAAFFTLAGVAVGALGNWLVTRAGVRRAERRATRAASRLIGRELNGALYGIREWLREGSTAAPAREALLKFPAWKLYHEIVARELVTDTWDYVSEAYQLLYTVRTHDEFAGKLDERAIGYLERTVTTIENAIAALRPAAATQIGRPGA